MRRLPSTFLAAAAVLAAAAALLATPAHAKEPLEARLDAPIPMGTPGGRELLVGVMVTGPGGIDPLVGARVYLKLAGRDGTSTREQGTPDGVRGHYTFRIAVPSGGVRDIEVGIDGTTQIPIMLLGEAFAFGDVGPRTAQLAPGAPAGALAVDSSAAPVADSGAAGAAAAPSAWPSALALAWPAGLALAILAIAAVVSLGRFAAGRRHVVHDAHSPDGARDAA